MNDRIKSAKIESEPSFRKTIDDIKATNFKSITSIDKNVSDITSNKQYSSSEHLKSYLMPWILLQSPGKLPQFTKHSS